MLAAIDRLGVNRPGTAMQRAPVACQQPGSSELRVGNARGGQSGAVESNLKREDLRSRWPARPRRTGDTRSPPASPPSGPRRTTSTPGMSESGQRVGLELLDDPLQRVLLHRGRHHLLHRGLAQRFLPQHARVMQRPAFRQRLGRGRLLLPARLPQHRGGGGPRVSQRVAQRGVFKAVEGVHVDGRLEVEQELQHRHLLVGRGQMQGGPPVVVVRRHVDAVLREHLDRLQVAGRRRVAQLPS
eukprot:1394945-Rhodomonas_salina.1